MNSDTKIISIIGIITVLVVVLGVMFAGGEQGKSTQPAITVKTDALVREDSLRVPSKNAKVQLVEFADFECPACAMLHPSLKKILAEYGDKIDYTFRVIPIHKNSVFAASAVFAAREQGKFIQMNDVVFEHQDDWTAYGKTDAEISAMFDGYAQSIGLDMTKYKADLTNNAAKYKATIDTDAADAMSMGINSTPTGIINGKALIRGVVSYDKLKQLIDDAISGKDSTSSTATSTASTTISVKANLNVSATGGEVTATPVPASESPKK